MANTPFRRNPSARLLGDGSLLLEVPLGDASGFSKFRRVVVDRGGSFSAASDEGRLADADRAFRRAMREPVRRR